MAGGGVVPAAAALLLMAAAPAGPRPSVMLMTGLPLVWGETGPFDPASRPAAAYAALSREFDFRPVDVLDSGTLKRGRLLFLAQPQRLAPAELAALDGWLRSGGRALILTDPMLAWPSELPLGDIRRPPRVGLLAPLLGHWRLRLDPPSETGEAKARWNGRKLVMHSPGRLHSSGAECKVAREGWTALCRLGRGTVRIVADADLMHDSLWAPTDEQRAVADNPAVVGEWLDALAGTSRPRPRLDETGGYRGLALPASILAVVAAGAGLLLRRLRRR